MADDDNPVFAFAPLWVWQLSDPAFYPAMGLSDLSSMLALDFETRITLNLDEVWEPGTRMHVRRVPRYESLQRIRERAAEREELQTLQNTDLLSDGVFLGTPIAHLFEMARRRWMHPATARKGNVEGGSP